jgi:hypothetical protein
MNQLIQGQWVTRKEKEKGERGKDEEEGVGRKGATVKRKEKEKGEKGEENKRRRKRRRKEPKDQGEANKEGRRKEEGGRREEQGEHIRGLDSPKIASPFLKEQLSLPCTTISTVPLKSQATPFGKNHRRKGKSGSRSL